MIGVIAAVCGKVECDRKTFLTRRKVTAVECVGFGSSRETSILADCPGAEGIHGAVRGTEERRNTRHIVEMLETFEIVLGIYGFYRNEFGSCPVFSAGCSGCGAGRPGHDVDIFKIGFHSCRDGLFVEKTVVEITKGVEDIAANVNEIFDAGCLKFFHAGRSTGHNKFGTAVEIFECGRSEFCIFVIA